MKLRSSSSPSHAAETIRHGGFSRTDVVAAGAALFVLAAIWLPALASTGSSQGMLTCMNNLRQLALGWQIYSFENNGMLVQSGWQGGQYTVPTEGSPWVVGKMDFTTSEANTNISYLLNPKYAKMGPYVTQDPSIFKCPADTSLSGAQASLGWKARVRSYSMSVHYGGDQPDSIIESTRDFLSIDPAKSIVFVDESADNPLLPYFHPGYSSSYWGYGYWAHRPAKRHNDAGTFAFADGHVEPKFWTASVLTNGSVGSVHGNDPDLKWFLDRFPWRHSARR